MARAQGARAQMALAFESTYGTPPAGGFTKMPFASTSLGAEQPLLNSELLGYGRDPLAPVHDAVTADGDVVVPLDAEAFGFWLKAAFGARHGGVGGLSRVAHDLLLRGYLETDEAKELGSSFRERRSPDADKFGS